MTDTMKLWDAVSKTNPANTKKVNQRGGFTAINAHSQVMEATRQFGPIGIGWGYETGEPIFRDNLIVIPVTLWHGARENSFGPIFGGAEWISDKGRLDSDAPKKATTDAVTKGLSQLGFNADVFLGLFDDNKYIEAVTQEFEAEKEPAAREKLDGPHPSKTALRKAVNDLITEVRNAQSGEAIDTLLKAAKPTIAQASAQWPVLINGDPKIEEDGGLKGVVEDRRAALDTESMVNRAIRDMQETVSSLDALSTWRETNSAYLEQMDGEDSRRFQAAYDAYEASLTASEQLRAG